MPLELTPIDLTVSVTDKPDIAILTSGTVDGDGIFDVLMQVTKLHLLEEFDAQRLTGKEYTTVYLSALDSVMKTSVAYISNHISGIKANAEVGLIRQKIVTELSLTDEDIPAGLGFNNGLTVAGLNNATQLKTEAETVFTDQKTVTELAQTGDILPANFGKNLSTSILGIVEAQLGKIDAEEVLLRQKGVTELAQTDDVIPAGTGINTGELNPVVGVVGKQKGLFQKQTDGFDRDAEQKLVKMMIDTWTVRRTTDTGTLVDANGLDDAEIKKILDVAKIGIGSTAA